MDERTQQIIKTAIDLADELARTWALDRRFEPDEGRRDDGRHERWRNALPRAGKWTT